MAIQTLRIGSKGPAVLKWEQFLRGRDLLVEREVDENYTQATHDATWEFQRVHGLFIDGAAGPKTQGYAVEQLGFERVTIKRGNLYVSKPSGVKALTPSERETLFGGITFKAAGTPSNPEAIKITNDWQKQNLGTFVVPQLKGIKGAPTNGKVFFHKKSGHQLQALFQAWENEGLLDRILTWGGSWVPRFIRGSRTTLSNHAYATAFDINAPWNGLGQTPAAIGKQGSVQELLEIAVEHGFFNGSWFTRRDGMHFEVYKTL